MTSFLQMTAMLLAGIFTWSLLEYFLHNFIGHWKNGKNAFTQEHMRHHREAHYFAPAWKKAIAGILVISAFCSGFSFLLGPYLGISYGFGLSAMYLVYEIIHKRCHTHAPRNWYGRYIRRHHFLHHFKSPKLNHGVTSPIWDIVFGTFQKPEIVRVPKRYGIPWLIDPATGQVKNEFQKSYELI